MILILNLIVSHVMKILEFSKMENAFVLQGIMNGKVNANFAMKHLYIAKNV